MSKKCAFGLIKVNNNIIVQNVPVDKKFWDVYLKCCANEASLEGVELIKTERKVNYGYHLYFDKIDMSASVVCFKVRFMNIEENPKTKEHEEIQQPA